jgi:hypothetical protein
MTATLPRLLDRNWTIKDRRRADRARWASRFIIVVNICAPAPTGTF